jgi:hypothetical protein
MRLPLLIHSGTVAAGSFDSAGFGREPNHGFDSSFCGLEPGILGTAYCGVAGFFVPGVEAQPASSAAVATATAAAKQVKQFPRAVFI